MLAGLIFAIEEAADRPGTPVATLPFGGMTLLEHQIRLLAGAGAERVLIAVGRMTPGLLAAVNRAQKRQATVEIVRSAEEAAEKMPAAARVLVIADGLVTTEPVVARMAADGPEALLVTDDAGSSAAIERLDMRDCWAGIARISADQLGEIAQMPEDYDFQSALLRVAAQAGAEHVPLPAAWLRAGHGVQHSAEALAGRNDWVLAAVSDAESEWADRWLFSRLARLVLPMLVSRGVPPWALAAAAAVLAALAVAALAWLWSGTGLGLALVVAFLLATGTAMARLRGDDRIAAAFDWGMMALFAGVALVGGWMAGTQSASTTPPLLALAAVVAQLIARRVPVRPRRWWASAAAHLLILAPFAMLGQMTAGLGFAAAYAVATLVGAVERTREEP
jgi:hypothetical protein